MDRSRLALRPPVTGRRRQLLRIAAQALAAGPLAALLAACGVDSKPLDLPAWMAPGARWRRALPAADITRLDLAIARHARSYRDRNGPANYREFAVPAPHGQADVAAAIDAALTSAGRKLTRPVLTGGLVDEHQIQWRGSGSKPVELVYLAKSDPARHDLPDFALLFEPK